MSGPGSREGCGRGYPFTTRDRLHYSPSVLNTNPSLGLLVSQSTGEFLGLWTNLRPGRHLGSERLKNCSEAQKGDRWGPNVQRLNNRQWKVFIRSTPVLPTLSKEGPV